jgi:hypothetical protein
MKIAIDEPYSCPSGEAGTGSARTPDDRAVKIIFQNMDHQMPVPTTDF